MTHEEKLKAARKLTRAMSEAELLKAGYINLSEGNAKYKNTDSVRYLIFNIPAIYTCPYACPHCKKSCYAKKSERYFTTVLSRMRNFQITLSDNFVDLMIKTIEYHLNRKCFKGKKCIFRIHESGDFYNQEYTDKWLKIIDHFKNDNRIVFGAYTKSSPYFITAGYYHNMYKQFTLNGSVWTDTRPDRIKEYSIMDLPIYTALTKNELSELKKHRPVFTCKCNGCGSKCVACFTNSDKYNYKAVVIH